jgi:hypothetical protein
MLRLILFLVMCCFPMLPQSDDLRGFTQSALEHQITVLQQPLRVRGVQGVVRRKQGDEGPLSNVLFEVRGPGTETTIRRVVTDHKGRFNISGLKDGQYTFKVTLNGFQSVVGVIELSRRNPHNQIRIGMLVGV